MLAIYSAYILAPSNYCIGQANNPCEEVFCVCVCVCARALGRELDLGQSKTNKSFKLMLRFAVQHSRKGQPSRPISLSFQSDLSKRKIGGPVAKTPQSQCRGSIPDWGD